MTWLLGAGDPFWVRLVSDPRLVDIAQMFLGPDIALFASPYISKPPLVGQQVLWHQDGAYWPLEPMRVVTLDESQAVDLELSPGDIEVHHPNILHGSHATTSPRRRCSLTICCIPHLDPHHRR